jgi:flagellar basal body-associated protein FliL
MNKKSLVLLVIIILLLGWLVASSVTTFQELSVGKTQSTNPGGSGTGPGSSGSGPGSGSGGTGGTGGSGSGSSFSGFSFGGFPFSLNFTGFFHLPSFNFPHFNTSLNFTNFHFPFNLSFLGSLFSLHGGKGGTGGPGGSGGSSGNSGTGNTGTGTGGQVNPILPIILNPIILIIIVAIVSVVLAFTVVTHARKNRDTSQNKDEQEEVLEPVIIPENAEKETKSREELMDLQRGETIASLSGWKSPSGLIHPPIPADLPLIWQKSDTFNLMVEPGSQLIYSEAKQVQNGAYALKFQDRCNLIKATREDEEDSLLVRAIDYSEDIRRFFLLNFVNYNMSASPSMTAREIIAKMKPIGSGASGSSNYDDIVSAYERSYYGYKKVMRDDFEQYLRNLSKLNDPKIIICAGN